MEETAGHIDYGLRPSARGKGHGTTLLGLALRKAREMGLREVLVMCRKADVASPRVIESNGGVRPGKSTRAADGETILRCGIGLPQGEQ